MYYVTNVEPAAGDLGKIGDEYYLTRGHLHPWRPAAEVYITPRGQGVMLLEDEWTGEYSAIQLAADSVLYIPGYTAHRRVNVGDEPLDYWGICTYNAGHDYQAVQQRTFKQVVTSTLLMKK